MAMASWDGEHSIKSGANGPVTGSEDVISDTASLGLCIDS
jgi:hypothetical protein